MALVAYPKLKNLLEWSFSSLKAHEKYSTDIIYDDIEKADAALVRKLENAVYVDVFDATTHTERVIKEYAKELLPVVTHLSRGKRLFKFPISGEAYLDFIAYPRRERPLIHISGVALDKLSSRDTELLMKAVPVLLSFLYSHGKFSVDDINIEAASVLRGQRPPGELEG